VNRTGDHIVRDHDLAVEVLSSPLVSPPPVVGQGATLALRAAMARFSPPETHPPRRAAVDQLLGTLDAAAVAVIAGRVAAASLATRSTGAVVELEEISRAVPVTALAVALGLIDEGDDDEAHRLVRSIERIAAVILQRAEPDPDADEATECVLARAAERGRPRVPVASVLYQALDATATSIAVTLDARATGRPPAPVAPRTARVAVADGRIGGIDLQVDDHLTVDLAAAGLPEGAGPHACPGATIAARIAAAVIAAIDAAGWTIDRSQVVLDDDGRPASLRLIH
jgi:cytochrome P450